MGSSKIGSPRAYLEVHPATAQQQLPNYGAQSPGPQPTRLGLEALRSPWLPAVPGGGNGK